MKVKNKKALIAIIIVSLLVVGVTFAYFTTSSVFNNLFNIVDYNVVTQEVFESPDDWAPGDTVPRTLTATNEGTVQTAVRVKYTEVWKDENDQVISNVPNNAVIINFTTPSNWTYNSTDGYYYYNYALETNDTTSSLITGITLNPNLDTPTCVEANGVESCTSNVQGLEGAKYYLTFTIEAVQYSRYQELWNTDYDIDEYSMFSLPSGRTIDNLQAGDEICIEGTTTECFNFVKYDGNDVVMLSKYNLNVGSNAYGSATGKQDSNVRGYLDGATTYGDVAFSANNYWYDSVNDNLKSKYGNDWNTNDIYDTDYASASGASYSISYYVEQYKTMLVNDGVPIKSSRLLKYSEAVDSNIGCSSSCPTNNFITNTSFWLGSAGDQSDVWLIASDGDFIGNYDYDTLGYFGVRPVIVVAKADM